jgi:hypothetical protein
MVKSAATIAFICAVALGGLIVATRPTVADGRVLAAELLDSFKPKDKRLVKIECDRRIPIGIRGAAFHCVHGYVDGSTVRFQYTMDRAGSMVGEPLRSTHP